MSNETPTPPGPGNTSSSDFGPGYRPPINPQGAVPPPPPPPQMMMYAPPPPPRKDRGIFGRIITGVATSLILTSLLLNVYLCIFFFKTVRGPSEVVYAEGDAQRRVVILPVNGMIDDSTFLFVHRALKELEGNLPKAIVLRVDSPGGGVAASDRIWYEISQFKSKHKDIPIVASYGSLAASGGYYISAQADLIVSEPTTLTGSIGVIAQAFTVDKLLDKVGVTPEVIVSTKSIKKDGLNPMRAWTEADRTELRVILDEAYTRFVDRVFAGRGSKLTREQVEKLATGEPYTTKTALELKLVDEEGFIDTAITRAKKLAKIDTGAEPQVSVITERKGGLMGLLGASSFVDQPSVAMPLSSESARKWIGELATPHLEYRMIQ